MKKITNVEFRKRSVDMLAYFTEYCEKNSIVFYMFYGSLIGTMRHQGFIPWDDDIDIMMPRPEYERLISLFNRQNSKYRIVSMHTDSSFTAPLAKVIDAETLLVQHYGYKEKVNLGIYIDIFILDSFPNEESKRRLHMKKCMELMNKWSHANHSFHYAGSSYFKDVFRSLYYLPVICRGTNHYLNEIDNNAKKFDYAVNHFVGNAVYPVYGYRDIHSKEDFQKHSFGMFEGIRVPIPSEYDSILTKIYGDWRKLPPLEQQKSHHDFDCYLI